jgi:hypothetical protein
MSNNTATKLGGKRAPETPRLAKVIGHLDPDYSGALEVQILKEVGNTDFEGEIFTVKSMSPFQGQTSADFVQNNDDYDSAQKSYGMWFVPPDVGTLVIVLFINGDGARGYWIGCVQDTASNFMLPGMAATKFTVEGGATTLGQDLRAPTAELNKVKNNTSTVGSKNVTQLLKPTHLFAKVLDIQGLLTDDIRGITTSSARRETPSTVFGISTPGPVDRRPGAPAGLIGKQPNQVKAPISRLGGTTFVMDDGDTHFRRKTTADKGPPAYASVEAGETTGDPTIPHNELVRIRTRTGHQILLHNSEDLIYIGNAKGTAWIELTSHGKIDIFAADSISVHTKADMNFYADRDINMEAGRSINMKSKAHTQIESAGDFNFIVGGNYKVKVVGDYINVVYDFNVSSSSAINLTSVNTNLNSSNNILMTANLIGQLGTNVAGKALKTTPTPLTTFDNIYSSQQDKINSILKRIPNVEPWPQHENLDPLAMTSAKTDIASTTPITFSNGKTTAPDYYLKYTTATDTFDFIPKKTG